MIKEIFKKLITFGIIKNMSKENLIEKAMGGIEKKKEKSEPICKKCGTNHWREGMDKHVKK